MSTSEFSTKKIECNERACIACGFCRDWYWCPKRIYKHYIKRDNVTCIVNSFDDTGVRGDDSGGVDHGNDNYRDYYHVDCANGSYGDGLYRAASPMCQCSNIRP